jgi:hypothetical protein
VHEHPNWAPITFGQRRFELAPLRDFAIKPTA